MIGRRRDPHARVDDLGVRPSSPDESRAPAPGGLRGLVARALGLTAAPIEAESAGAADPGEIRALRAELTRELERAAQRNTEAETTTGRGAGDDGEAERPEEVAGPRLECDASRAAATPAIASNPTAASRPAGSGT